MPLPSSGPLSLQNIQTEFGGTNPIGLNEYYAGGSFVPAGTSGTYGAVPSSGQISIQNFYGTTAFVPQAIMSGWLTAPGLQSWPWTSSGFGSKFADPSTAAQGVGFVTSNPTNTVIAGPLGNGRAPWSLAYSFSVSTGFGSRFATAGTPLAGAGTGCKFSPNGNYLAFSVSSTPFLQTYNWSSGFGSMVSAPGTVANAARSVAWRPQEDAIAIGTETTPWIAGYVWTGSGYGSKYANPATLPTGLGAAIKFSPDGNQIALAHTNSPFVSAWAWSSGFGSKFANPAVLPLYTGLAIDFSPSGNALATGGGLVTTEYSIGVYAWSSSGFGTKYADPPATPFTQRINGVSFNLDGTAISFAVNNNQMPTYPWSFASGFGTKYADAPSIVAAGFTSVSFTN